MSKTIRTMACAAVAVFLSVVQAGAVTYSYTGNPDPGHSNNYLTAIVDLACAGPCAAGDYTIGSGINSFSITAHNSSGVALDTISLTDAGITYYSYVNQLTLDGTGNVTMWFLLLQSLIDGRYAFTLGHYDDHLGGCAGCGPDQEYFSNTSGATLFDEYPSTPGSWTAESAGAVPVPATLPLFAGGLGVMGLFARRKRRNLSAAAAA